MIRALKTEAHLVRVLPHAIHGHGIHEPIVPLLAARLGVCVQCIPTHKLRAGVVHSEGKNGPKVEGEAAEEAAAVLRLLLALFRGLVEFTETEQFERDWLRITFHYHLISGGIRTERTREATSYLTIPLACFTSLVMSTVWRRQRQRTAQNI